MAKFKFGSLLSPNPTKRVSEGENPTDDATDFNQAEIEHAGRAMQQPIKEAYEGTRNTIAKTFKTLFGLPLKAADAVLSASTKITGTAAEILGKGVASIIELPLKVASSILTAPVALASNVARHAFGLAVKMPISTALVGASYIGRGINSVSIGAKTIRDRINSTIDSGGNFVRHKAEEFNQRINAVTISALSSGGHAAAHAH